MSKWDNDGPDDTIIYDGDEVVAYANEPIATQIVTEHNAHAALLAALKGCARIIAGLVEEQPCPPST